LSASESGNFKTTFRSIVRFAGLLRRLRLLAITKWAGRNNNIGTRGHPASGLVIANRAKQSRADTPARFRASLRHGRACPWRSMSPHRNHLRHGTSVARIEPERCPGTQLASVLSFRTYDNQAHKWHTHLTVDNASSRLLQPWSRWHVRPNTSYLKASTGSRLDGLRDHH
jgi:hypothetical protein